MRTLLPILGLMMATGCDRNGGVWLVQLPGTIELICVVGYNENFNDANPPVNETNPTLEWTYFEEHSASDQLIIAQIERGRNNEVFLFIDGDAAGEGSNLVYPGKSEGGEMVFEWEKTAEWTESDNHSSGYVYGTEMETEEKVEITLTENKDTKGMDGNWSVKSLNRNLYRESDEWVDSVGLYTGQINPHVDVHLEGSFPIYAANQPDLDDCSAAECNLEVTTNCDGEFTFSMQFVDFTEEAAYTYAAGYGQPPG